MDALGAMVDGEERCKAHDMVTPIVVAPGSADRPNAGVDRCVESLFDCLATQKFLRKETKEDGKTLIYSLKPETDKPVDLKAIVHGWVRTKKIDGLGYLVV